MAGKELRLVRLGLRLQGIVEDTPLRSMCQGIEEFPVLIDLRAVLEEVDEIALDVKLETFLGLLAEVLVSRSFVELAVDEHDLGLLVDTHDEAQLVGDHANDDELVCEFRVVELERAVPDDLCHLALIEVEFERVRVLVRRDELLEVDEDDVLDDVILALEVELDLGAIDVTMSGHISS